MTTVALANEYLSINKITSEIDFECFIQKALLDYDNKRLWKKIIKHKLFNTSMWNVIPSKYIDLELLENTDMLEDNIFFKKFETLRLPTRILSMPADLKTLVQYDYRYLSIVPVNLKTTELCNIALEQSGAALQYIPHKLQTGNIIKKACVNIKNLKYAAPKILSVHDIIEIILENTIEHRLKSNINLELIPEYYHYSKIVELLLIHDLNNIVYTDTINKTPHEYVHWIGIDYFYDNLENTKVKIKSSSDNNKNLLHEHILQKLHNSFPELYTAIKIGLRGQMLSKVARDVLNMPKINIKPHKLPLL